MDVNNCVYIFWFEFGEKDGFVDLVEEFWLEMFVYYCYYVVVGFGYIIN